MRWFACVLAFAVWLLAFHVFSMPVAYAGVATLFAAMPVGINAYLMAARYKTETGMIAASVLALSAAACSDQHAQQIKEGASAAGQDIKDAANEIKNDPDVKEAGTALGIYAGGQSILVGTPSGVTLAPEGGAHQSITTPLIGLGHPDLSYFEPAYVDELEAILRQAISVFATMRENKRLREQLSHYAGYLEREQRDPIDFGSEVLAKTIDVRAVCGCLWRIRV